MTELFKQDVSYAARGMLYKYMGVIANRLSEGYSHKNIVDEILKIEKNSPEIDLVKIKEIIDASKKDRHVLLSGQLIEGGMSVDDIYMSLYLHAVKIIKEKVKRILLDVTACIDEANVDYIEMILLKKIEKHFPFENFKDNKEWLNTKMLLIWVNAADKVMPSDTPCCVGDMLNMLDKYPFSHFSQDGDLKEFIKIDRDLATFYPEFDGVCYDSVKLAYQLADTYKKIANAPKEERVIAASKGLALKDLVNDDEADVRFEVANQGYGLDLLIADNDARVKRAAKDYLKSHSMNLLQWTDANPDKWGSINLKRTIK